MKNSRTINTAKNSTIGLIGQFLTIVLTFISRSFFIKYLGVEYLGVNGLFSNILTILSFAEFGIGNAIIFGLYKPLAKNDTDKVKSLMSLFSNIYKVIGAIVFVIGLCLIPFLNFFIKEELTIKDNLYVIYLLFLINTSSSYFFTYKKSIIIADQKKYIITLNETVFKILFTITEVIFLILFKQYLIYLTIQIIYTIFENVYISYKSDKMYPYIKDKNTQKLPVEERKFLFSNVKALFIYKFGSIIMNGTDNILISTLIGITYTGLYSNYHLIVSAFSLIIGQILNGFTASIGNLNAVGSEKNKERVFNKTFFLSFWIAGFFSVGILLMCNDVIKIWIGEEYLLPQLVVISIVLNFYVNSVQFTAYTYRTTMGLFVYGKITPIIAAILNIGLSILLGYYIGLSGIIFATSIARFLSYGIVDPILVYKYGFDNKKPYGYFLKYFLYIFTMVIIYLVNYFVLTFINLNGILYLIICIIVITIIYNVLMYLIFSRSKFFNDLKQDLIRLLNLLRSKILLKRDNNV